MSTLGKIVTVFIVIASVALGAMIVTFVRSTNNWHEVALAQQSELRQAEQARKTLYDAIAARNSDMTQTRANSVQQVDGLRNLVGKANEEAAAAQVRFTKAEEARAAMETKVASLTESFKVVQAEKDALKTAYDKAISESGRVNEDAQSLAKDKYDLLRTVKDLEQKVRLYEQRIVEQDKELAFLKHNFKGTLPEAVPTPTTNLNGLVKAADNARRVVEISLGSSDGVAKGLTFMVSRNNQYLADLVITEVDENSSVGQLKTVQGEVREGDNVTFEFRK